MIEYLSNLWMSLGRLIGLAIIAIVLMWIMKTIFKANELKKLKKQFTAAAKAEYPNASRDSVKAFCSAMIAIKYDDNLDSVDKKLKAEEVIRKFRYNATR